MQEQYTLTRSPDHYALEADWARSGRRGKYTGQKAERSQKRKRRDMRRRYPHGW